MSKTKTTKEEIRRRAAFLRELLALSKKYDLRLGTMTAPGAFHESMKVDVILDGAYEFHASALYMDKITPASHRHVAPEEYREDEPGIFRHISQPKPAQG
jgi:hypothetical protein